MDYIKCSKDLCELQIRYAGAMNEILDTISSKGEDGIVLWLSQRKQETFPIDIVEHFRLSSGRVTNILRSLEKKDLLHRIPDTEDKRKVRVELTAKGKTYANEQYALMLKAHQRVLEALGDEKSRNLIELMKTILGFADKL